MSIILNLEKGLNLTNGAPQNWMVDLPDVTWSSVPKNGTDLSHIETTINVPNHINYKEQFVDFLFDLVTCTTETCLPKSFLIKIPIKFDKTSKSKIIQNIKLVINPNDIKVL